MPTGRTGANAGHDDLRQCPLPAVYEQIQCTTRTR